MVATQFSKLVVADISADVAYLLFKTYHLRSPSEFPQ